MLIPSIDIVGGRAVQLIGGEQQAVDGGDPLVWLDRFAPCGEVAVVDIDAARGDGTNRPLIEEMCRAATIRVGGGIRDAATAARWLDNGAAAVVIGTAASPELLSSLPRERVIAAVDSAHGRVLSHGWRHHADGALLERVRALAPHCRGILATFVELEGRLGGTDMERTRDIVEAAGDARVTIAGGITSAGEVAALDAVGADAQVGMALYTGRLDLATALTAPMSSDRADGLWPTVVVDETGVSLGLVYSDLESVRASLESGRGVYHSRSRGIWVKGETSGDTQELIAIAIDCDRDTLRFTVRQRGDGFCHLHNRTCWGEDGGLSRLGRRMSELARRGAPPESNTVKLLEDEGLLAAKLIEEAGELAAAGTPSDVVHEAADVIYFTLVKAASAGVGLDAIAAELDRRELRVTRRSMERTSR